MRNADHVPPGQGPSVLKNVVCRLAAAILLTGAFAARLAPPPDAAAGEAKDETAQLLGQVQKLIAAGEADSAIVLLIPHVATAPSDGRIERALVTAALAGGIPALGIHVIEDAIPYHPGDVNLHLALGDLELGRGRPEVAVRHFQRALVLDSMSPEAAGGFARARARLGTDIEPAIAYFNKLALQKPGTPLPRYGKGVLLMEASRVEESLTDFRWAIGLEENNWLYERDYGRALSRLGDQKGAVAHLENAKRLLTDSGDPLTAEAVATEIRALRAQGSKKK